MKKIFQIAGWLLIISGIIFLFIYSSLVTASPGEDFARDLFGLPIPHPPIWTSYIPFIGSFLGIAFEFLSLHGLIGVIIFGILLYIGGLLVTLGEKERQHG